MSMWELRHQIESHLPWWLIPAIAVSVALGGWLYIKIEAWFNQRLFRKIVREKFANEKPTAICCRCAKEIKDAQRCETS